MKKYKILIIPQDRQIQHNTQQQQVAPGVCMFGTMQEIPDVKIGNDRKTENQDKAATAPIVEQAADKKKIKIGSPI